MNIPNPNYLQAELLCAQLIAAGIRHVVISPGSRSTPLARTAALNEQFTCHVFTDERVAGFYALGLVKGGGNPSALICTSGTAAAHYYPAVIEAAQAGYPLVVLTTDRPRALRNTGAPQTIDQTAIFGRYARMALDLSEPQADAKSMREMLYWVRHALTAMLSAPEGPIQINVPTDEPLAPLQQDIESCNRAFAEIVSEISSIEVLQPPSSDADAKLIRKIESSWCGLIVCGPDSARTPAEREAIHTLARKLGWPMFADVASGLRFSGEPNLPLYDLFLRHDGLNALAPDLVIEFGGYPTSKTLNQYLNRHRAQTIRVQRDSLPRDPDNRAAHVLTGDVAQFLHNLILKVKVSRDSFLLDPLWRTAGAARALCRADKFGVECEAAFVVAALDSLPDKSNLVLASSMPIRYADMLAEPMGKIIHVYAQRSTNGIDGVLSQAAGIAVSSGRPTLLICGDLAFLHDLGGLQAARKALNLNVLLLNNNGGGIFHFLPISSYSDTFEKIHGTPVDVNLSAAEKLFNIAWSTCRMPEELAARLDWTGGTTRIIEVQTERERNRTLYDATVARLLRSLK